MEKLIYTHRGAFGFLLWRVPYSIHVFSRVRSYGNYTGLRIVVKGLAGTFGFRPKMNGEMITRTMGERDTLEITVEGD